MAFGASRGGSSRGGRPGMGGRAGMPSRPGGAFRGAPGGLGSGPRISRPSKPVMGPMFSGPATPPPPPPAPININFGSPSRHSRGGGGNGLVSSLLGSAVSAGVGVASAAIVNKIHENSQMKLAEKQAEQQAEYARQQAAQQAEYARQQAEYQMEIERLKVQQEETKRDTAQDLRYYANCPYCLGVNNGGKFCQYCGSSLAYYEDDDDANERKNNNGNFQ